MITLHLTVFILYLFGILQKELSFRKKMSEFGIDLSITSEEISYAYFLQIPWYAFLCAYNGLNENLEHYISRTCIIILISIWMYSMYFIPMKKKEALRDLKALNHISLEEKE